MPLLELHETVMHQKLTRAKIQLTSPNSAQPSGAINLEQFHQLLL